MEYLSYKTLHLISVTTLILSFGLLLVGLKIEGKNPIRKFGFILHGISWLLVIITAFGLVSVLNLHVNFPTWAKLKTLTWILLGIYVVIAKRFSKNMFVHTAALTGLSAFAIYLAVFKPFAF